MVANIVYYKFNFNKMLDFLRENDLLDSNKRNSRNCLLIRVYTSTSLLGIDGDLDFFYQEYLMNPSNLRKAIDLMRKLSHDINQGFYSLEFSAPYPVFIEIFAYNLNSDRKFSKLFYKNILSNLKEGKNEKKENKK